MFRCIGFALIATTFLLVTAVMWADAQAPQKTPAQKGKEPQLAPMPKGFDKARTGIDKGTLETVAYDSKTVGAQRKMVVYLPPGYAKSNKYPVFYLLHGKGGNETSWKGGGKANTILDNLYADKKLVPMIVVMPNGTIDAKAGKGAKGGKGGDAFESELLNDIMPTAEGRFPIIKDADHRAVAGLSMGGGQALRAGLRNMDKFAYVGGFSSALFGANNLVTNDDANKKLKLLYVACGDSPDETLFSANKNFHTSLDKLNVKHVWNVVPDGKHDYNVWKNDLYLFSQMIFKEKK